MIQIVIYVTRFFRGHSASISYPVFIDTRQFEINSRSDFRSMWLYGVCNQDLKIIQKITKNTRSQDRQY